MRLPSRFKKAVLQTSAYVFTLSGANIVVSETILSRPECEDVATAGSGFMIVHNLNHLARLTPKPASMK